MKVYTVNELCESRDCLTPGCPLTALPGTERCSEHTGRTDVGEPITRLQPRRILEPTRPSRRNRWTKPEMIEAIQEWAREHGRPPAQDEWHRTDHYLDRPTSYQVRGAFGTWSNAIEAAGFERRASFGRAA